MAKIALLQTTELPSETEAELARLFDVIAWPEGEEDRAAVLDQRGEEIRAIAGLGKGKIDGPLLDKLPKLEIISSYSAGVEAIDTDAVKQRGVKLFNTSAALDDEVADLAVWLLQGVTRRMVEADRFVRAGKWPSGVFPLARSINGLKVGILGLGHIGKAVAARLGLMGAQIGYHGRHKQDVAHTYFSTLGEMATWCDALIVCAPASPQTDGIVDANIIAAVGAEGYIVNISRGSLIDEDALVAAVAAGQLAGVGLDVFADEPNVPQALIESERTVLLPHIGSATNETRDRMGRFTISALTEHFGL